MCHLRNMWTSEWFQPQAYEVIPAVTVISLWALSFTYPVSPSWKTIFCDKAINRYSSTAFLANCFNSLFIQRDSLRCLRRIKAEVHRTMSVRNEITKGIRFNDVHCTGKNKWLLCSLQIKSSLHSIFQKDHDSCWGHAVRKVNQSVGSWDWREKQCSEEYC